MESRLLTTDDVSKIFQLSRYTLAAWRKQGFGPPFITLTGGIRYPEDELWAWVKSRERGGTNGDVQGRRDADHGAAADGRREDEATEAAG